MMKQPDPKTYTEAEMMATMNGSVGGRIMAAIKEWQQSRSEAMMHGATTKEGDRFKAACDALAAVVCK